MTTGTPRNEEEVTSFSPGVAQKLISAPVGFLGAYLLPLTGGWNIQEKQHCLCVSWLFLSQGIVASTIPYWSHQGSGTLILC